MIIAAEKKKTNIVEFVLYMWYIEDLIRAHDFDLHRIEQQVIGRFEQPETIKQEMKQWYSDLIVRMQREELISSGHLHTLTSLVFDLNDLHLSLINNSGQQEYIHLYHTTQPFIAELKLKMKPETTEIEACLNGLYGVMLLHLKGKEASSQTSQAMEAFSRLLALLNQAYMDPSL